MVSPLWLAFSPTVRAGTLLHYLKITLPGFKPLQVEQKTKLFICVCSWGEKGPVSWTTHGEVSKVSLVFIAVPEQTRAPWCPLHILPDGVLLSVQGTEVFTLCQRFSAPTLCCVGCILKTPSWVVEKWCVFQKEPVMFVAQSKGRNNNNNGYELYLCSTFQTNNADQSHLFSIKLNCNEQLTTVVWPVS